MAVDGHLNFDTKIDTGGFNSGVKNINSACTGLKSTVVKLGAAVTAAFSVAKLVQFGKESINLASDMQEVQNVVDTAFGEMSYKMEDFADTSIKKFGISKLAAKQTGSTFMAMAAGMNIAQDAASDMAVNLTGLSADMASFYNVEQDVASTALKSVFTGETETLKQFGIVMTEANLEAYALSQGMTKSLSDMTQAEKVMLRYNYVMSQTTLAQGDFAKTQGSWANQTRILKENFKELGASVGSVLMSVILPAVKALNGVIETLIEWCQKAATAVKDLLGIEDESSGSGQMADSTSEIVDTSSDAADNYSDIADSAEAAAKAEERQLASFDKINKLSNSTSTDTSGTITPAITAPVTTAKVEADVSTNKLTDKLDKLKDKLSDMFAPLKDGFNKAVGHIQKGIDSVNWGNIADNFKSIANDLKPIASAAFKGVTKVAGSAMETVGAAVGGMISVTGKSLETGTKGISDWLKKDKGKITEFIDHSSDQVSKGFNNLTGFSDQMFGTIGDSIDRVRPQVSGAITNMLSGFTTFGISVGTVLSDGFRIASESIYEWSVENEETIGTFFDNLQLMGADVMNLFGEIFGDIGTIISDWWNGEDGGATIFKNVCDMFTNIGTTLMNVFNEWIKPVWDFIVDVVKKAWDNCLKPVFDKLLSLIGKVADLISALWNNILSPIVNWVVDTLKPIITTVLDAIGEVFGTVFGIIGDVLGGVMDALGGLIDFITGIFTGDWEKAWNGIKDFFKGIWDAIWGIIKGVINLIIDAVNTIWSLLYSVFATIVDIIGGIAGFIGDIFGCDWSFSMPEDPPLIPKLATGTVVPANYGEFLAVLGDNKRETEVVSPLSTMKQALKEALAESGGAAGGSQPIQITLNLDGKTVYKTVVDINKKETQRTGVNALAY